MKREAILSALSLLFLSFSVTTAAALVSDLDADGDVDGADLRVFAHDFGKTSCLTNDVCGRMEYCRKTPGECRGEGECVARPRVCPDLYDPVCGCDGRTYANACDAAAAGVNITHRGQCLERCAANSECSAEEFCKKAIGDCLGAGQCAPRPEACPRLWEPVCGCDGETYANACVADSRGVNVVYPGECRRACKENGECRTGSFCAKKEGDCGGLGECVQTPAVCPDVWAPVCGCDGKTYGNVCEAAAAGVSVAQSGECRRMCGGVAGLPCPDGMSCDSRDESCSIADLAGVCVALPPACTKEYMPVCGCDGKTYPNDCERIRAGAVLAHPGPCEKPCADNGACAATEYCAKAPGACEATEGSCRARSAACPEIYKPVCGCDGKTHANACFAAAAGVNVAHEGECKNTCTDNKECRDTDYCAKAPGDCTGTGRCEQKPGACPLYFDPVCGCDGKTYGNACDAAAAGVNIAAKGPCRPTECDDGTPLLCLRPGIPQCSDFEMLAIRNSCYVCVNPATCLPWGQPGCKTDTDCPAGEKCDPCGTSSCPFCDNCLPACRQ